jgi:hypothetical protein
VGKDKGTKAALMREMGEQGEFAPKLPRRTPVVGHRPRIPATVGLLLEACERFSKGETLSAICLDAHMPDRTCLWRFTLTDPQYEQRWSAAKAMHAEHLMDQTGAIADREVIGPDGRHDSGAVMRDKLRIEQRHMRAAVLDPARWGRKTEQTIKGDANSPIVIEDTATAQERRLEAFMTFLNRAKQPPKDLSGFGRPVIEHRPTADKQAMSDEQWNAYVKRIGSGR